MTSCSEVRSRLSAFHDGELSASEHAALAQHLGDCAECRVESERELNLRRETERTLGALIDDAPPVPAAVADRYRAITSPAQRSLHTHPRRRTIVATILSSVGLAAAMLIGSLVIWPMFEVAATPAELLSRAKARFSSHQDLEFHVTPESEALELLSTLLNDSPEKQAERNLRSKAFRVLLASPNRLLIDANPSRDEIERIDGLVAFDGEKIWSFDAETNEIHVRPGPKFERSTPPTEVQEDSGGGEAHDDPTPPDWIEGLKSKEFDPKNIDLMSFLTAEFVNQLGDLDEEGAVREVTGPYEERIGHRVFEFDLRTLNQAETTPEEERILKVTARVVVDPRTDLIEKVDFDLNLGGLSLVTLRAELVAVDQGLPARLFNPETHAGPKTRIVEEKPEGDAKEPPK